MKVVINACFGGYSLSPKGIFEYYKRKGLKAYFFKNDYSEGYGMDKYLPTDIEDTSMFITAFSVPNPNDYEKEERWEKFLNSRPEDRTDKDLIEVVEELGEESWGSCAELKVVEIPDGIDWEIDEYDGNETIQEQHRSWN